MEVEVQFSLFRFGLSFTYLRFTRQLYITLPFIGVYVAFERPLPEGMSEPTLAEMRLSKGEFFATMEGGAAAAAAEAFGEYLTQTGAKNYVNIEFMHSKYGPLEVTIQRKLGKSPSTLVREIGDENTKLRAELAEAHEEITSLSSMVDALDAKLADKEKDGGP